MRILRLEADSLEHLDPAQQQRHDNAGEGNRGADGRALPGSLHDSLRMLLFADRAQLRTLPRICTAGGFSWKSCYAVESMSPARNFEPADERYESNSKACPNAGKPHDVG